MSFVSFISLYKWYVVGFYLTFISIMSFIITAYDKIAAKKWNQYRIPEATLFTLSALGGSVAMLVTMFMIRHKTRHKRFMLGIPFIIALQILAITLLIYFGII